MAVYPKASYTSVTVQPPYNWEAGEVQWDNQTPTPNSNGQYTFTPLSNVSLAAMLSAGWSITAFTA